MASREAFLRQVWDELINRCMRGSAIDKTIAYDRLHQDGPFADTGPALERLLAAGCDRRDLSLIMRDASYKAVFGLLYMLSEPGVDGGKVTMLHESLLTADPSGKEGRPGSAP